VTRRMPSALAVLSCLLVISLGSCGFGTSRGSPYDFSRLEPVVKPILGLSFLEIVNRRERGTNCHGQGCERPLLTYTFHLVAPAGCKVVQQVVSTFREVSKPFSATAPGRCAYAGEVLGHAVTVGGHIIPGGNTLRTEGDTAEEIQVAVFADRLGIS